MRWDKINFYAPVKAISETENLVQVEDFDKLRKVDNNIIKRNGKTFKHILKD